MFRSTWGRTLVVACAIMMGRAGAQEGTVPVTIRSTSVTTPLEIGRFEGAEQAVGFGADGSATVFRDLCTPLCTTPCTLQLPPGNAQLCTSQGGGWVPHHSADLNVPPTGADVSLRPFAERPYLAGFFLSLIGAVATVVGGIVLASWAVGPSTDTKMIVGSAGMGLGGALLATGIPIAVLSGREGIASVKPKNDGRPTASLGLLSLSGTF
jgi:hypothetical protein